MSMHDESNLKVREEKKEEKKHCNDDSINNLIQRG